MTFDAIRILRTLTSFGVRIPVRRALELADELVEQHREGTVTLENLAYSRGYEAGKRDAEVPSNYQLDKLQRVYDSSIRIANEQVAIIVDRIGKDKKIQVIKELRNITGLGLKDTKDIVDAYIVKLNASEVALAEWERDLLNEANQKANYLDEPPF
ncbi:hypothetical protein SEA_EVY_241 [Streptomyces phage Evy]|uniref:Large ribosomal subunit protein bL12 C-terminal domain-containing protein n=1 Tax=Streptomyces phage Evy TaxID=2588514 RepID=A0A514DJW9_9CAUD|nr:hypothetical protein KNU67_gp003 [Streptomyces phage Evy]YP_010103584.1 hypothetical protein KNU67_gp057 [Streptomyces phage Evy]UEM46792.1 hypothetical protein SEA_TARGARYEN_3 [Streptomyces phage Targaryen]QDH93872.1 hypothetical protein SEA_EVY_3 [Streptomyces phage Evy]QDH94075.1 hypothetical protein SEA_EVY_241 [Streptomyces phage Evy]UEM46999.1 hypothetical protein SEA_TARGARYEN_254 [Streptomyces phage Targaryen]